MLAKLAERYSLVLVTKGDLSVQRRRVADSNLAHFLTHVHIVSHKSGGVLSRIIQADELDPVNSWAVGNSLTSDILPALENGLRAVLIPANSWAYEQSNKPIPPGVIVIQDLKELPEVI